jgi:ABC-type transport system involved in cytochrome c biogenesis permease subunit
MKNWKRLLSLAAVPFVILGIGLGEILSNAGKIPVDAANKLPPWSQDIIRKFARLPLQEEGRVKPVETFADFTLLRFHGSRTLRLKYTDGTARTLKPTEWLLDCLFYPEVAKAYPIFIVDNPAAVTAAGVKAHDSRRQRYSFNELEPALPRLRQLHDEYNQIKPEQRERVQGMIIGLAENIVVFERLVKTLDWARDGLTPGNEAPPPPQLAAALKNGRIPVSAFVRALEDAGGTLGIEDVPEPMRDLAMNSMSLPLYPPPQADKTEWMSFGHLIIGGMVSDRMQPMAEEALANWETLTSQRADRNAFASTLAKISSDIEGKAAERGQEWRIPWETFYNRADFFYYALQAFVLAFILQSITWLKDAKTRSTRWLHAGTWLLMGVGLAMVVTGMVVRAVIMGRWVTAVVTNLYETILFISSVMTVVGLAAEALTRRKLALPVTAALAAIGMFISMKYEAKEASDTLSPLEAVLNTNYWLSIHVTTINMGYAAGMLAAGFAGVYLIARLFDPRRKDAEFYRTLTRCTYGVVCFGLLFSLVGTVLGGLWANDSWGRFWGWDPKENGALMIVLSFLIILHARMGGYIREFGLHLLTVPAGAVVAFSWWHVNLLGVGKHSYGFTTGIKQIVFGFYGLIAVVFLLGVIGWFRARSVNAKGTPTPPTPFPARAMPKPSKKELAAARKAAA